MFNPCSAFGAPNTPSISGSAAFVSEFQAECSAHHVALSPYCPESGSQQVSLSKLNLQTHLEKLYLPVSPSPLNILRAFIATRANGFES